jgi:hypothetical protein
VTVAETITDADVGLALSFTQKVIDACGPRLPGSAADLKAADMLYREMSAAFDEASQEEFTFAPNAFLGFFDFLVVSYLIATLLLFLGGAWLYAAAAVLSIGVLAGVSQFIFYWGWFDVFYHKTKGVNVVGVVHPADADKEAEETQVRQEILVCGHHDSANVVNFLLKYQKLYAFRLILGSGVVLTAHALTIVLAIIYAATGRDYVPLLTDCVRYGSLLGFFIAIPLLFYRQRNVGTSGAGDNMISCAIAVQIGKILQEAKNAGQPLLRHTRVRIVSFDAEEAALKGSKAYVRRHRQELLSIPTYAFCPDCLYRMKDFALLTGDQNGLISTPPKILKEAAEIARRLGYSPALAPFTFGGGATDSASFLKIGVPALTIIGMDTGLIRDGLVYHTPRDLVENIDREIVEATMKTMMAFIINIDKESRP